jgi:hypothetical protein
MKQTEVNVPIVHWFGSIHEFALRPSVGQDFPGGF